MIKNKNNPLLEAQNLTPFKNLGEQKLQVWRIEPSLFIFPYPPCSSAELESTIKDERQIETKEKTNRKKGKFYNVTVWNTSSVTSPLTVVYTDPATTVSIVPQCIAPGATLPPAC